MAYSEWTLESVVPTFQLEKIDTIGLFSEVESVPPSDHLTTALAKKSCFSYRYRHRESAVGTDCRRCDR